MSGGSFQVYRVCRKIRVFLAFFDSSFNFRFDLETLKKTILWLFVLVGFGLILLGGLSFVPQEFLPGSGSTFWNFIKQYGFVFVLLAFVVLGFFVDRARRRAQRQDQRLRKCITRDRATGLFNEQASSQLLDKELVRARRNKFPVNLIFINVISANQVQQAFGDKARDRLLYQLSETLKKMVREYDHIFKDGEDSFVLVFPETAPQILNELCERFKKKISKRHFQMQPKGSKIPPRLAFGAACFPLNGDHAQTLLAFARQTVAEDFDANVIFPQLKQTQATEETPEKSLQDPLLRSSFSDGSTTAERVISEITQKAHEDVEIFKSKPLEESPAVSAPPDKEPENVPEPTSEIPSLKDAFTRSKPPRFADEEPEDLPDVVLALGQEDDETEETQSPESERKIFFKKSEPIQVIKQNHEEVIMVDFDREKEDIAEKFRRRLIPK